MAKATKSRKLAKKARAGGHKPGGAKRRGGKSVKPAKAKSKKPPKKLSSKTSTKRRPTKRPTKRPTSPSKSASAKKRSPTATRLGAANRASAAKAKVAATPARVERPATTRGLPPPVIQEPESESTPPALPVPIASFTF